MNNYTLSTAASRDLRNIARYSVRTFGRQQARVYGDAFRDCFKAIAENPYMGQSQDLVRPGLRRLDLKRHSIYYIPHDDGVLVVRVLHYRQDAWAHLK